MGRAKELRAPRTFRSEPEDPFSSQELPNWQWLTMAKAKGLKDTSEMPRDLGPAFRISDMEAGSQCGSA